MLLLYPLYKRSSEKLSSFTRLQGWGATKPIFEPRSIRIQSSSRILLPSYPQIPPFQNWSVLKLLREELFPVLSFSLSLSQSISLSITGV
jgi:hypothetical protein